MGVMSACKPCSDFKTEEQKEQRRARDRRYARDNPTRKAQLKESRERDKERKKAWFREQKSKPCTDCKQVFPSYVMDFDHVRGTKVKALGEMVCNGYALETIKTEIAKCDLVCSNCHRLRTFGRDDNG